MITPKEPCLIMLDFDGTLAKIAPRPELVQVDPEVPKLLIKLQKKHRVYIVTGRLAKDVTQKLSPAQIPAVGLHGLDGILDTDCKRHKLLDQAVLKFEALQERFPQMQIEDKGRLIAVHTRRLPLYQQKTAALASMIICSGLVDESKNTSDPLDILHGHKIVELRPKRASKANAVLRLLKMHPNLFPVYIGDDLADEEAFEVLPSHSLTIRVSPEPTQTNAKHILKDSEHVRAFLNKLK